MRTLNCKCLRTRSIVGLLDAEFPVEPAVLMLDRIQCSVDEQRDQSDVEDV